MGNAEIAVEQRWYRQWWLWFVVAIPLIGVVSGTSLVIIAGSGHDALVVDDYYKKGKAINLSFARQERALALGLRFELSLDGRSLTLRQLAGPKLSAARLHLYHPTLAERDHHLQLTADAHGVLRAPLAELAAGHWRLSLEAMQHSDWLLQQQLQLPLTGPVVLGTP